MQEFNFTFSVLFIFAPTTFFIRIIYLDQSLQLFNTIEGSFAYSFIWKCISGFDECCCIWLPSSFEFYKDVHCIYYILQPRSSNTSARTENCLFFFENLKKMGVVSMFRQCWSKSKIIKWKYTHTPEIRKWNEFSCFQWYHSHSIQADHHQIHSMHKVISYPFVFPSIWSLFWQIKNENARRKRMHFSPWKQNMWAIIII